MNNPLTRKIAIACLCSLGGFSNSSLAATEGQIILVSAPGGLMYAAAAEFGGSGSTSLQVRAGGFNYSYKSGDYWEDGSGSFLGAAGRFYTSGSMEGFFLGAGVDYISGDSTWGGWGYSGYSAFSGIAPSATIGYKILTESITIEPSLTAELIGGHDVGLIVGAGITLGTKF